MRPPTFIIDFDSTLITVESLDELASIALAYNPKRTDILRSLQDITTQGMAGTLPFDVSLQQRLQLFTASKQHVAILIDELITHISPSVLQHRKWFTEHQNHIFVISGGFEDYIVPIVELLGIPGSQVYANKFIYDNAGNILKYDPDRLLSKPHGKMLQLAALRLTRPIIVIGDGYTDLEMVKHGQADEFWAYIETVIRPIVTIQANRIVSNFSDVVALTTA